LRLLAEGPGYYEKLRQISMAAKPQGARIHEARIAALCLRQCPGKVGRSRRERRGKRAASSTDYAILILNSSAVNVRGVQKLYGIFRIRLIAADCIAAIL
jgi:hypothetical protein